MTTSEPRPVHKLLYVAGGLLVLATCALAALGIGDGLERAAFLAAGATTALAGAVIGARAQPHDRGAAGTPPAKTTPNASSPAVAPYKANFDRAVRNMFSDFRQWLPDQKEENLWPGFDQLVREMLDEHLGGGRVRCYHVPQGGDELRGMAPASANQPASGRKLLGGVLAHVVTTGHEYVAGDPGRDERMTQLAGQTREQWAWVWAIRRKGKTIGLVTVGTLPAKVARDRGLRQSVASMVCLFWEHVATLEELRVAERTDRGSGVLNRRDFFTLAANVLNHAYSEHEPVVIAAITLEGLRGLDDEGMWEERDALVAEVGGRLARRLRTDDLVGRFSDDRFVVLLRRLDGGLGRLITEQILTAAEAHIADAFGTKEPVCIRAGLAASGSDQPPLDTLLTQAFGAAVRARQHGERLECEVELSAAELSAAEVSP